MPTYMAIRREFRAGAALDPAILSAIDRVASSPRLGSCAQAWDPRAGGDPRAIVTTPADLDEVRHALGPAHACFHLEHEILHRPQGAPRAKQVTLSIEVRSEGDVLRSALVVLLGSRAGGAFAASARTDELGRATLAMPRDLHEARLVVHPVTGHWTMTSGIDGGAVEIECPPLPEADRGLGWWHAALGIDEPDPEAGKGVRIGVIDTGFDRNEALGHVVRVGPKGADDAAEHGTHVLGIIGARPVRDGYGFLGVAPGAALLSVAVDVDDGGADQAEISHALDRLSKGEAVDLINLSMASRERSGIVSDRVLDVYESGTLCICAAGNQAEAVGWPARDDVAIGVSAIGRPDRYPRGSIAARACPVSAAGEHGYAFASFSCRGEGINCCGPGVGVISTIPRALGAGGRPWAAMNGTSMAAPAVCGALAVLLARRPQYLAMPRDGRRADLAARVLREACRSVGLLPPFEGAGMPRVSGP